MSSTPLQTLADQIHNDLQNMNYDIYNIDVNEENEKITCYFANNNGGFSVFIKKFDVPTNTWEIQMSDCLGNQFNHLGLNFNELWDTIKVQLNSNLYQNHHINHYQHVQGIPQQDNKQKSPN